MARAKQAARPREVFLVCKGDKCQAAGGKTRFQPAMDVDGIDVLKAAQGERCIRCGHVLTDYQTVVVDEGGA